MSPRRDGGKVSYSGGVSFFEGKLKRVMTRLGVDDFDWNHDRYAAWVEFRYKGGVYRFHQSLENATQRGVKLATSKDCLAQIVLSLEDLARMVERGLYDLQTWVAGMKALPPGPEIPDWCKVMGFAEVPADLETARARYRELVKKRHPDHGGTPGEFMMLQEAMAQAEAQFGEGPPS